MIYFLVEVYRGTKLVFLQSFALAESDMRVDVDENLRVLEMRRNLKISTCHTSMISPSRFHSDIIFRTIRDAGSCPTRKLSDKTQPNDTRICRRTSVSDKFSVGQIPPSEI